MPRTWVHFYLNNDYIRISDHRAFWPLAMFLRRDRALPGTKVVCAEGDCGACTTVAYKYRPGDDQPRFVSLNSCITLLAQLDGHHIITVEGLGTPQQPAPEACALAESHGSQCGYCTPGFVMSLAALKDSGETLNRQRIKNFLTGNLCRCTGYEDIIQGGLNLGSQSVPSLAQRFISQQSAQVITDHIGDDIALTWHHQGRDYRYLAPADLATALAAKEQGSDETVIWAGGTDLGVALNKGRFQPRQLLNLARIADLDTIVTAPDHQVIGANVTLSSWEASLPQPLAELKSYLRRFAAMQIKNTATLAGNIANGSPIGDTMPALMALDCQIELTSRRQSRWLQLSNFYQGYKAMDLSTSEIITRIKIPIPKSPERFRIYKVSKRRDLDISALSAAIYMPAEPREIRIAYGGVAAQPLRLTNLEDHFAKHGLNDPSLQQAATILAKTITPLSDHRGSASYRQQVAANLLRKYHQDMEAQP